MPNQSIIQEAKVNSKLVTDLDNLRRRYQEIDLAEGISVIYPSAEIYSFERYYFEILSKSVSIKYLQLFDRRPDLVSHVYYNTVVYWPYILLVNRVDSIEDFRNLDRLIVPPYDVLLEMAKNRIPASDPAEKIDYGSPTNRLVELYKKYPADSKEVLKRQSKEKVDTKKKLPKYALDHIEKEEIFTLTSTNVSNKYVDLTEGIPANTTSVLMYVDDLAIPQQYGYDYILTIGETGEYNRVSWHENDVVGGQIGFRNLVKTGTVLTIKYIQTNLFRYKSD